MSSKIILSLVMITLITGCSIFSPRDISKETLLLNHLQGWEKFRLDGIAEVTISQFRIRKNIQIIKTAERLNIALYDSGIFGLRPTPFLSTEIDSSFSMNLPQGLDDLAEDFTPETAGINIDMINELFNTLRNRKTAIVRDGRTSIGQAEIIFNDKMQIDNLLLHHDEANIKIEYLYRRDSSLDRINLYLDNNKVLEIIVDTIKYG